MRIGTLFSGIGSPEQGASRVYKDLELTFACEWDKFARESFNANYDITPEHFHKDISDMDGTQYKDKVDIIIGGSPCQDFSIAGLRAGVEGKKGVLIYEYIRIIEEVSPPIFIYENVKGMLSQTMLELPIYNLKDIEWQNEYQKSISNTLKTTLAKYLLGIYKENSDLKSIRLDTLQTKNLDSILEKLEFLALTGVTKKLQYLVTAILQTMKKQKSCPTEQTVQLECKEEDLVLNQKLLSLVENMSRKDISLSDITEIMKENIDLLQNNRLEDLLERMKSYIISTEENLTIEKKFYAFAQELNTCLFIINLWKSSQNLLKEVLYTSINQIKSIKSKMIIDEFVEAFRGMGYYCHYEVLNTKDYGVPQNRERIFLVGFKDHEHYYNFSFAPKQKLTIRLKDLLEDEAEEKYYLSDKMVSGYIKKDKDSGYINQNTQASSVFSTEKESPSLCAGTHGYAMGYIQDTNRIKRTLGCGGGSSLSSKHCFDLVAEPKIVAMRGRNPDNSKSRESGLDTVQMLEYNENGTSNCLTTVQKDNLVDNGYRIRKLTPRECFRLQDFPDTFKFVGKSYFKNELSVKWYNDLDKRIIVKETLWKELAKLMGVKTNMLQKDFVGSITKDGELTTIPTLSLNTQTEKTINANTVIGLLEKVSEECALDTITPGELMAMQQELIISQVNKGLIKVSMDIGRTDMQKSKKMESSNIEIGLMLKVSSRDLLKKERLYTTLISIKKMTQWITYGCLKDKENITLHIRVLNCADLNFSKEDLSSLKMENINFVSNSQLYKQAGNSISANVMEMIFNQIEKSRLYSTIEGSLF